ncbi:pentatricopeptide repeat-containing protein DOT4, chloroplastic [Rutidosis leptorrhynchoides]|uniref:pentatricopeptide repeat-containing protein DOT4, chloroplastic n=1 Tax=Rutidosis leptorrhynchoides TaxID=125765 RepID=UPI003A999C5C
MLLITKPTTVFSSGSSFHQFHTQIHHCFLNKNVNFHSEPPSITSQLLSPSLSTKPPSRNPFNHQITHHNANITKFCEMGNLQKAMNLIFTSEKCNLDTKTYCDVLQLCADLKALNYGKQVYNIICLKSTEIDHVLGSKLVFMFVSCGDLKEGRRIFNNISDNIPKINVFLWNFMMNAYAKNGDYKESVYLFTKMIKIGFEPDGYTFTCIFKCLAGFEDDNNLSDMIHGYVLKSGFGFDCNVVNSMIALYFKRGSVDNALKLFVEMPDRDVITWNTMISGYVANGLALKGFEVFVKMLCSGVSVDLATMVSVVIACANKGDVNLGRGVHGYAVKTAFNKKMKFSSTLLDMYSKCRDTDAAMKVFDNMDERSVVSWTSMISGFAREGEFDKAINLFLEMKKQDVKPDTFTVTSILHACALSNSLEKGKEVHTYIKENEMQSLVVSNALMDMYAKCGSMDDSYYVFSQMNFKDIVSWNTMIGGYSKNCLPSDALDLFKTMQHEIKPDNVTMTCILPACASLASLNKGREIHGYILRKGLTLDHYVVNALIDMYVKCGELGLAKSLFNMTISKNLVAWTIIIAGYCMHGFGHEALLTFKQMRDKRIEPNEASLTSILYACSHSGLFQEGWKFYNLMVNEYQIEPKLEHYGCMVDLFSRAGKLLEGYKFIISMPVRPDATIWGSLLCGCRFRHDVKLAEQVAEKIFELEPENTEYYVLLANIYSETEKWEEVKTLRGRIKKNKECSWIEIKGKVNVFVAGDKQNPDAKKIESLIDNLRTEMKNSRKLKRALVDEDSMEKEGVVCGHSESLAVGCGILKLPTGRTIRVTKNVRVCGDCHELAKFISKSVGRQIVLRDSNRFHHFKDGFCSCRGYW